MFLKYRNKYKKGENEFHLDNQKYIELSLIIILLLVLMLFIINIESLLRASEAKSGRDNYINLEKNDIFVRLSTSDAAMLRQGVVQASRRYKLHSS